MALEEWVREEIRPEGTDVALDCVGSDATARQALAITCKGGRAVLVGLMPAEMHVEGMSLQRGERALVGVQMYLRDDFLTAMRILAEGAVPGGEGVLAPYDLDATAEAFQAQRSLADTASSVKRIGNHA